MNRPDLDPRADHPTQAAGVVAREIRRILRPICFDEPQDMPRLMDIVADLRDAMEPGTTWIQAAEVVAAYTRLTIAEAIAKQHPKKKPPLSGRALVAILRSVCRRIRAICRGKGKP